MAILFACRSSCCNPPLAGKDELAGAAPEDPTYDSGTFSHILAVSHISTPALALPLASSKLVAKYTNRDL